MGRRLYVGNLPYTTGEAELQELFSKAGTVESVRVMRDAATGRLFLVLEYVDGPSCQFLLDRTGPLAVRDAVRIAPGRARVERRGTGQAGAGGGSRRLRVDTGF